jgi:protein-S-isoprenylcysteine O-methyltransferase Ste14
MSIAQMRDVILMLWIGLVLIWLAGAVGVKRTRWRESVVTEAVYTTFVLAAAALMLAPASYLPAMLTQPLGLDPSLAVEIGLAATALGVGLSVWARWRLGANWSAAVTLKEGHVLVRTGPYRFLRHPMYSGFLCGFAGTALASDELRAFPAFGLLAGGLIFKSRIEEVRLSEAFPEYRQYCRRAAALIPFIY